MRSVSIFLLSTVTFLAYAGGNNEQVKFPLGYQKEFVHYDTRNRVGKPQIIDLYANKVALETAGPSGSGDGSIIIMEIYKANTDIEGRPITTASGLYEKGKLAAVAVMEKRSNWDDAYPQTERAGHWGFALYTHDGQVKDNDLDCKTCHRPLQKTDFMFSYPSLLEYVGKLR